MKVGGCGPAHPGAFADPLGCCEGNELCVLCCCSWRSVDLMKAGGCGPAQPGAFVDPLGLLRGQ